VGGDERIDCHAVPDQRFQRDVAMQPGGEYRHHGEDDDADGDEPPQATPGGRHCSGFAIAALVDLDHRSLIVRAIAGSRRLTAE
jgi:hypothetical protein